MLIDFHTHFFPDLLARRSLPILAGTSGITPHTDATMGDTLRKMDEWGVDRAVVLHIATKPAQQANVNRFAAQVQEESGRFLSFGSVHPAAPDALEAVAEIHALGLHGIKLHPDYQGFFADDKAVYPIYECAAALGLPILFHAGWDPISPTLEHASPWRLAKVVRDFPNLKIIAAHLGGVHDFDETMEHLAGKSLWMDTAVVAEYCPPEQVAKIIRTHGIERILFGSDCPWSTPQRQLDLLERAGFSPEELDLITHRNAQELLGLS